MRGRVVVAHDSLVIVVVVVVVDLICFNAGFSGNVD